MTNGEKPRNDVGYCSFGSSRVRPQGQLDRSLPGYLEEKHNIYIHINNNFLGISNDHTLFIHVNSTTAEHQQQKMQQQNTYVCRVKAGYSKQKRVPVKQLFVRYLLSFGIPAKPCKTSIQKCMAPRRKKTLSCRA